LSDLSKNEIFGTPKNDLSLISKHTDELVSANKHFSIDEHLPNEKYGDILKNAISEKDKENGSIEKKDKNENNEESDEKDEGKEEKAEKEEEKNGKKKNVRKLQITFFFTFVSFCWLQKFIFRRRTIIIRRRKKKVRKKMR
jgi:hypothetical protein